MPDSPFLKAGNVIDVKVLANGTVVPDALQLSSIRVERSLFRMPEATLVLLAPYDDKRFFFRNASKSFSPGVDIEIQAGYAGSSLDTIFKGILVNMGLCNFENGFQMTLRCTDKAFRLTRNQNSRYFQDIKDSDIFKTLAAEAGLTSDIAATTSQHRQVVQYNSTDWDFMLIRAAANGLLAYVEDGKVFLKQPTAAGSVDLELDMERDVTDFDIQLETRGQIPSATRSAWDPSTQSMRTANATEPSLNNQGNVAPGTVGAKIGLDESRLATPASLPPEEIKAWADTSLVEARTGLFQGTLTFFGNARPRLNSLIQIKGFSERFDGNALITGVQHSIQEGMWRTTISLGASAENPAEVHPQVSGLMPPTAGLQIGIVKKLEADPVGEHRILVQLPAVVPGSEGIWARMAHFYATAGKGAYFLPEIGDEVVLGFLHDDPRFPVVLGSLYSSHRQPPYPADDENKIKAIVTKNDIRIEFNDDEKVLRIRTPNGNYLELSDQGILLNSAKDITLKATGQINIDAGAGVTATAGANVVLEAVAIKAKAKATFTAEGVAQATLSSSGQTTVKGAMVMIN